MAETLLWVLPLVPTVTALLMLTTRDRRILSAIDVGSSTVLLALTLVLLRDVARGGPRTLGVFRVDDLGLVFLLLLVVCTLAVSVYTVGWLKQAVAVGNMKAESLRSYFVLVHAFVATMVVTVLADNLGVLWIAMEGTTITSAVLIGYHGHRHGLEAAWKYIIVTTIGISFGLFGTVLVYAAAADVMGSAGTMSWSAIMQVAPTLDPGIVRIGFIFVMIGYGTKAGLAPMHLWLPDAHSQAPTPVSALLSGVLIKCALLAMIRFQTIAAACGPSRKSAAGLRPYSVVVATPSSWRSTISSACSATTASNTSASWRFGSASAAPWAPTARSVVVNHGVTRSAFFAAGSHRPLRLATCRHWALSRRSARPPHARRCRWPACRPSRSSSANHGAARRHRRGSLRPCDLPRMVVVIFAGLLHHAEDGLRRAEGRAGSPRPGPAAGDAAAGGDHGPARLTIPADSTVLQRATEVVVG